MPTAAHKSSPLAAYVVYCAQHRPSRLDHGLLCRIFIAVEETKIIDYAIRLAGCSGTNDWCQYW